MPRRRPIDIAAGLLLAACAAGTAAQVPTALPSETAAIRRHHLQRAEERRTISAQLLEQSCRFESDIAAHPPAGRVALTFDDGPDPGQTPLILQTLARHGLTATFFMIGRKMQQHPELVEQVRAAGQLVIGNHSWDHPNFHDLSASEQADEVLRIEPLLTGSGAHLFRYPYGNSSCETNELVHARGYRIVGWHVDSCDWAYERNGSVDDKEAASCEVEERNRSDFVGHVVAAVQARHGGIVLLHEIHPKAMRQLDAIIERLRAAGYGFGSVLDPDFADSLR